jgi:hypothetical protein
MKSGFQFGMTVPTNKTRLLKVLPCFKKRARMATWRSGYAAVCKTVYPGSIPGVASTREINRLGDREGGRPDPRHAAAYDHQHRAAGARQYVAAVRGGPRMRPGRHGGEMAVVRCSDSDDEAEPAPRRAPLGNTGF